MQAVLASQQVKTADQIRGGVQVAQSHYFAGTHKMEEEGADSAPLAALLKEPEAIRGRALDKFLTRQLRSVRVRGDPQALMRHSEGCK